MMRGTLLGAAALAILCCDTGRAQRPLTHEDVWLLRRVGTPVLSPDGRQVVVSVTEPSYDPEGGSSDLWLLPSDGSAPPRRLTATAASESGAAWSPDGKYLVFTTKRGDDAKSQVYRLDMTGPGEAIRLSSVSTGARNPRWSPDGLHIAFQSDVYPGATDDAANREIAARREADDTSVSSYEHFPIRHWDRWLDDRQVHVLVQRAEPGATARDLLAGTELVKSPGFSGVPGIGGDSLHVEWTPDGKSLVIVATTTRHESAHAQVPYHLYRLPLDGGEPAQLTRDAASYADPTFAPDGKLLCRRRPHNRWAYNLTRLARVPWPEGGAPTVLGGEFDRSVDAFALRDDGGAIVLATDTARGRLFELNAGSPSARLLDDDSRGVYAGPALRGGTLVARWEDSTHPAEIVRVDPATGAHRPLTAFNAERVREIDWHPFRELWVESSRGRRIHNWVALPAGFDAAKKYPLVVFIHGGPHSSSRDAGHVRWSAQLLAAPGYVVLLPDYTGSIGYGEQFARDIQGDPLRTPGQELLECADAAARRLAFVDGARRAAAGASYGGHLANWLQATTTGFRCLIGHAGLASLEGQWSTSDSIHHREINNGGPPWEGSPIWREQSPSTYAGAFQTPMLLTIGEKDYRVPLNQTLAMWAYLKRRQVPSKLLVYHDANHWIMRGPDARHFWRETHAWLARYLRP